MANHWPEGSRKGQNSSSDTWQRWLMHGNERMRCSHCPTLRPTIRSAPPRSTFIQSDMKFFLDFLSFWTWSFLCLLSLNINMCLSLRLKQKSKSYKNHAPHTSSDFALRFISETRVYTPTAQYRSAPSGRHCHTNAWQICQFLFSTLSPGPQCRWGDPAVLLHK